MAWGWRPKFDSRGLGQGARASVFHRPTCQGYRGARRVAGRALPGAPSKAAGGAVLVLPGFLKGSKQYQGLANILSHQGFATEIVPLEFADWIPVLYGGSFQFYTAKIDAALQRLYAKHGRVALLGHSAGGWVARLVLGDEPYEGVVHGRRDMVHTLLTLGTPHQSLEKYPFGRIEEQLSGPNLEAVPPAVRGSSLKFANHFYPRGDAFPGVHMVCIVGDAIRGRPLWGKSPSRGFSRSRWKRVDSECSRWGSDSGSSDDSDGWVGGGAHTSRLDAWFAWESYKAGCGRGDVDGDGVTPVEIAHLAGAENLVLPGVWHLPRNTPRQPWYGDPEVVREWVQYLSPRGDASRAGLAEEESGESPLAAAGGSAGS